MDHRPLLLKRLGDGLSDAVRAAGDDDDFICKASHIHIHLMIQASTIPPTIIVWQSRFAIGSVPGYTPSPGMPGSSVGLLFRILSAAALARF